MPLPSDRKVTFLGGLFVLALLAAAYVASEIVLPLIFAITLKLLLQPALRAVERLHVPRTIAALFLFLTLFGTIVGLGTAISNPARTWAAKLPEGIPRLQERLSFMREPIDALQKFLQQVEDFGGTGSSTNAAASAKAEVERHHDMDRGNLLPCADHCCGVLGLIIGSVQPKCRIQMELP